MSEHSLTGPVGVRVAGNLMAGHRTRHTATQSDDGTWQVSWLPDRPLTRDQATTAMVLAEIAELEPRPGDPLWQHVTGFAHELGLAGGTEAMRLINVIVSNINATDPSDTTQGEA